MHKKARTVVDSGSTLYGATPPSDSDPRALLRFIEDVKRQWVATVDALVDPLWIVDQNYRVHRANLAMARLARCDVKSLIGALCYEKFAGRTRPCEACPMKKAFRQGQCQSVELAQARPEEIYEVTSQPLVSHLGKTEAVVQIYRDRTAARQFEKRLAQQDKLASIGLLAGGIAHEINNPLGGILIFSQMLLRTLPQGSEAYQDAVEIEAATVRCKNIVERLLEFARQTPMHRPNRPTQFDAYEAIMAAVRFAMVGVTKTDYTITVEQDAINHTLSGDRNSLIQVFLNLIQNALHAMPRGGEIKIQMRHQSSGRSKIACYTIEDQGMGIPKEHLDRIFDPFFTTKEPGQGTGLGLAICFGIIQEWKGTIGVTSQVGVGTRFKMELPLVSRTKKSVKAK